MSGEPRHIAIVGGGLVGASLACALAPLGFRVTVIEAVSSRADSQPSYDDRTLALSHASCRILQGLGLWPALAAGATSTQRSDLESALNRLIGDAQMGTLFKVLAFAPQGMPAPAGFLPEEANTD